VKSKSYSPLFTAATAKPGIRSLELCPASLLLSAPRLPPPLLTAESPGCRPIFALRFISKNLKLLRGLKR